jgi:predicted transposase/invertase (TIGR01784 family)
LLFKANINNREGYIYFLFEHKSYTSKDIAFQLLKYMVEIWEAKSKKEKDDELPVIIPLVVYHGKDRWKIRTTLGEMITGYEGLPEAIKKVTPNYEYLLYDLSRYTDEEIKGGVINRIAIAMLRDIQGKDIKGIFEVLFRAAEYLQELEDKQTGIEYFETLMRYIFNARADLTRADFNSVVKKIETTYPEGSEVVMTLAEIFRKEGKEEGILKGMEKGMEKGIEVGAKQGKIEVAKRLIKMGLSMEQIVDATGLPKKEIEKIAKEIGN